MQKLAIQAIKPFVEKAIATSTEGMHYSSRYRHHGTWFGIRSSITFALCIMAVARSEQLSSMLEHDWREQLSNSVEHLRYWQDECTGVREAIEILQVQMSQVMPLPAFASH